MLSQWMRVYMSKGSDAHKILFCFDCLLPLTFTLSIHSFKVPHESWKNRHDIDVLIGVEHVTVSCSLLFDELYVSVLLNTYTEKGFFDEGWNIF